MLGRELGSLVANSLVREILDMGMPAQRAGNGPPPQIGDILISGQFVSIDEGSRGIVMKDRKPEQSDREACRPE